MTRRSSPGPVPLYFAFPDGSMHYVCAECTALCCRGHGFAGSVRREVPSLLQLYPALGSMATGRLGDIVSFKTLTGGGCPFLRSDNRCGVEVDHGKSLKPGVCALFPFNAFTRIGNTVAVSPHYLCPLRLQVPARPAEVAGTHAMIEPAVRESGLLEPAQVEAHMPPVALHKSEKAPSVLERETTFRDACTAALGRGRFDDVVRAASLSAEELDVFVERVAKVFAVPGRSHYPQRDTIDDVLLVLAPSLRLGLLTLPREGILMALLAGELLLRNVFALWNKPPTLQEANQVLQSAGPVLRLLSWNDRPLELTRALDATVPPFGDPELTFTGFAALRELGRPTGVLTALERTIKESFSTADRSILLHALAQKTEPALSRRKRKR